MDRLITDYGEICLAQEIKAQGTPVASEPWYQAEGLQALPKQCLPGGGRVEVI